MMIIHTKKNKVTNKEIVERIKETPPEKINESIIEDFTEISQLQPTTLLTITSFIKYLIADDKNKVFATPPDSIIGKNKKTLEKNHNCKIRIIKI